MLDSFNHAYVHAKSLFTKLYIRIPSLTLANSLYFEVSTLIPLKGNKEVHYNKWGEVENRRKNSYGTINKADFDEKQQVTILPGKPAQCYASINTAHVNLGAFKHIQFIFLKPTRPERGQELLFHKPKELVNTVYNQYNPTYSLSK